MAAPESTLLIDTRIVHEIDDKVAPTAFRVDCLSHHDSIVRYRTMPWFRWTTAPALIGIQCQLSFAQSVSSPDYFVDYRRKRVSDAAHDFVSVTHVRVEQLVPAM